MNGLRGINAQAENSAAGHSKRNEKSAQFKDLLDQSKQDIKQADQQLEKAQENRRESKSIDESNQRGKEPKLVKDIEVKSDDSQADEPLTEELKADASQENSALLTLDTAQLIGIENFQGGIEIALTRLNLKLGLAENKVPEGMIDQGTVIESSDMNDQMKNLAVMESIPKFDESVQDEFQVLQQNIEVVENEEAEGVQGLLKNAGSELAVEEELSNEVMPSQEKGKRVTDAGPESRHPEGVEQKVNNQAQQVKSETLIGGVDLTEEQSSEKVNVLDVQKNPINRIENQNPSEKSIQEINVTAINTGKAQEVQPDTKVEVAQQVQQKILQNFEPNKPMVLQMTLSPDNLGDIDIKLSYDQGKLIIDITAISQETQNLLGKQINLLVRGLALQNVQVETVHLNTPVEQSSDSQDATFMMNSGSDPNENQNQTLLRERFIKNSGVLNSILTSSDEDESVMIPQNLQNYTNHKVNYLI